MIMSDVGLQALLYVTDKYVTNTNDINNSSVKISSNSAENFIPSEKLSSNSVENFRYKTDYNNELSKYSVDNTPNYLKKFSTRRKAACSQKQRSEILYNGKAVYKELLKEEKKKRSVRLWTVDKPDNNAWRKVSWDQRSLYSAKEDKSIHSEDEPHLKLMFSVNNAISEVRDKQTLIEKTYICSVSKPKHPERTEQKRFSKNLMQKYCTPTKFELPSYCSPKDVFYTNDKLDTEDEIPEISINTKKYHPIRNHHNHGSYKQNAHCDTLGSSCCYNCIEGTNKKIAQDVERSSFPELECSVTTLVAPTLAMLMMKNSHVKSTSDRSMIIQSRESDLSLPPVGDRRREMEYNSSKTPSAVTFKDMDSTWATISPRIPTATTQIISHPSTRSQSADYKDQSNASRKYMIESQESL